MPRKTKEVLEQYIVRYFGIRNRSVTEFKQYLQKKAKAYQLSDEDIASYIEKYSALGLLNDQEFSKQWVEHRLKHKKRGPIMLSAELRQKGVSKDIIEQVIQGLDKEDIKKSAQEILEKNRQKIQRFEQIQQKWKAKELLARKGFPLEIASQVVDDWMSLE